MTREILIGREQICNGHYAPRKHFSKRKIEAIKRQLPKHQDWLIQTIKNKGCLNEDLLFGDRCASPKQVIWRMESAKQSNLKKLSLKWQIRDALLDCASSDFYYAYEKNWG